MIGTDLNLIIPTLSDTYSVALSAIGVALESIQDSIADKATQAGLDITGNLSLNGNHLTNVGGVLLVAGNTPVAAGSFYYADGKFYARDATGPIQLTASGAINASGFGAISGDFGGANPATVAYDDASGQYRFKEDATTWADLVADDVVLMEASPGTDFVRLTAPAAVTASYTVTFPAAPPGVTSPLYMSATGQLSAVPSVTSYSLTIGPFNAVVLQGASFGLFNYVNISGGVDAHLRLPINLPVGAIITGYTLYLQKISNAGAQWTSTVVETIGATGATGNSSPGTGTETTVAINPGYVTLSKTGLTFSVTATGSYAINVYVAGALANDRLYHAVVAYTPPA